MIVKYEIAKGKTLEELANAVNLKLRDAYMPYADIVRLVEKDQEYFCQILLKSDVDETVNKK